MKTNIRLQALGSAALLMLAAVPAWADGDIGNLPQILTENLGLIANVTQTLAVFIGLGLFIGGMFELKRYGEMRTMMSAQMTIAGPLAKLLAGVAMLFSPLLIGTLLTSFWGTGGQSDLPYDGTTTSGWSQYVPAVLMLVRLVGVFAFMRGFVLMAQSAGHHARPGNTGKVLVHVFAGILCVHIMGTIQLIESILGLNFQI